jgi:hypothetical protein
LWPSERRLEIEARDPGREWLAMKEWRPEVRESGREGGAVVPVGPPREDGREVDVGAGMSCVLRA